jgi:hydroxyethylthiazole kinase
MPNPDKIEAIKNTVPVYESNNKPIVLDPVGISMSNTRKKMALDILENKKISVVKGNTREIQSLIESYSKEDFSKAYNTVLITTGKTIEIIHLDKLKEFKMPVSKIQKLPGTGCILGTLIGCLILKGYPSYDASIQAALMMEKVAEKIKPTLPYGKIQEVLLNELEVLSNENLLNNK